MLKVVLKRLLKKHQQRHSVPGGNSTFSGKGVRPGFPKYGACEHDIILLKRGLVNWNFPNLGACELKISKFWACELKISQFGGLWAKIWAKIEAVEAKKFQIFQKGVLWTDTFCLKWDPCELQERHEKGVFRATHPRTPFLGQYPPGIDPYT